MLHNFMPCQIAAMTIGGFSNPCTVLALQIFARIKQWNMPIYIRINSFAMHHLARAIPSAIKRGAATAAVHRPLSSDETDFNYRPARFDCQYVFDPSTNLEEVSQRDGRMSHA